MWALYKNSTHNYQICFLDQWTRQNLSFNPNPKYVPPRCQKKTNYSNYLAISSTNTVSTSAITDTPTPSKVPPFVLPSPFSKKTSNNSILLNFCLSF